MNVDSKKILNSNDNDEDSSSENEPDYDLSNPDVVTKYKCAAGIANKVLQKVIELIRKVDQTPIVQICQIGDKMINEEVKKVFGKKNIKKGVAFPTSIAPNNIAGHFSPLETEKLVIKNGDLVKIDLGVHIDGLAAFVAHTILVSDDQTMGNTNETYASGRKADVLAACYTAARAALRLIKPGNTNTQVTKYINKAAQVYDCQPLHGVFSYQLERFVIDGEKTILNRVDVEQGVKTSNFEFEPYQVFSLDIVMSTGTGKVREQENSQTTIYCRNIDRNYLLKTKTARNLLGEINSQFPSYPFTIRDCKHNRNVKFGIQECLKHELVDAFPVLYEREGEYIAQIKLTLLLLPSGTSAITGTSGFDSINSFDLSKLKYSKEEFPKIDEDLQEVLAKSLKKRKNKSRKKNKSLKSVKDCDGDVSMTN